MAFTVTHPFHPLNGRTFDLLEIKLCWGEMRVYWLDEAGGVRRIPLCWTSLETPDPFVAVSAGRSAFRVLDLLALSDLVASLRGDVS